MLKDVESGDVLDLSVIYENDEESLDDGRVYNFYKYGESIEDTAMRIKLQLADYRHILDRLCQHSEEHRSMRSRLSKIAQRKIAEQSKNRCRVCNVPINLEKPSDFVACASCKHSPICKNLHCAIWSERSEVWNCKLCRSFSNGSNSACDWLISQLNEKLLQAKGPDGHSKIVWDQSSTNDGAPLIPLEQREKVREFVEELVSTLVGGSIDNAPVSQLSGNKECLPTGENEVDSIDQSHTSLKHLVERIIEEVFKIPDLFDHSGVPSQPSATNHPLPQFDPKKYEELLATAVLNKLVESYSYERRLENSSGVHSGSDNESNVQTILEKAQLETISTSSSNEPRSDSSNSVSLNEQPMSLTATKYIEILSPKHSVDSTSPTHSVSSDEEAYLSDYIQNHKVSLPGIEAHDSDSFDEDLESVNTNDTEGNWQENWLFRKRKLKNETATAIGMLVPSPMEDVKAFIGDKTTDEVSDLSEAGSDLDEDENEPINGRTSADLPHALIESKTIIGGKNEFGSFNEVKTIDELLQADSLVSIQSFDNQNPVIMEAKNNLILINDSERKENTKPIILQLHEKTHSTDNSPVKRISRYTITNRSLPPNYQYTDPTANIKKSLFEIATEEPPVPAPRKKTKSLGIIKRAASIEVSTQQTIQENTNLPDRPSLDPQIVTDFQINKEVNELLANKLHSETLDDELLDLSINDIYENIEGDQTIDYQSLVAEDENVDSAVPAKSSGDLVDGIPFDEDGSNATTQDISQLEKSPFRSLSLNEPTSGPSSNASNENYICKIVPTEFDLSVDSVLESDANILEVIVPKDIEDISVSQQVFMTSKPTLIAIEIASNEATTTEVVNDDINKSEQSSIPKLIISNICCDTPPPLTTNDDSVSLKPKKVLKAQDSLELPKDDRSKYSPAKRVDSFEVEDVDRNVDAKSALENIVNPVVEYAKNRSDESEKVAIDSEKDSEEDFVVVTDEEVKALKIEEQISLDQSHGQTESKNALISELKINDDKQEMDLNVKLNRAEEIEMTTSVDENQIYTSVLEIPSEPESNKSNDINAPKPFDIPKDSSPSLTAIQESSTQLDTNNKTSTFYTTSNLFTPNQTICLDPATNITELNEGPLPGSIAEREHLKWMNAQEIPNNPYSAEALQRRLSKTKSPTKIIDINLALATKASDELSPKTEAEHGKPLQIILGAGEPDHLRYGRDYYINDSKTSSGAPKKLLSMPRYSSTDEDNISSKATTPDFDVYTAKLVQIRDDPGHPSDELSKLKISDRLSENSSLSQQSDSLTLSDDSETRVYDLRKSETTCLRSDIIRTSRLPVGATITPPPTPTDGSSSNKNFDKFFAIKQLNQLKKSEEEKDSADQIKAPTRETPEVKPLSPETLKFFSPKPRPVFTSKNKMEGVASVKPQTLETEEKVIPQNGMSDKVVIEEDVISVLPSVKALAKNFVEPTDEIQFRRTKSSSPTWQVSNDSSKHNSPSKSPSSDSYIPMYESRYHPVAPGHSITARSLSTKFREELKHSISDDASNSADNIEIVERERDHLPDCPPSPVLLRGIFKEKMSFFENLGTK